MKRATGGLTTSTSPSATAAEKESAEVAAANSHTGGLPELATSVTPHVPGAPGSSRKARAAAERAAAAAVAAVAPVREEAANKNQLRADGRRIFAPESGSHYCLKYQTAGCSEPCPHKQAHACELCPGVHKTTDCKKASDATIATIRANLEKVLAANAARAAQPGSKRKGKKVAV